MLKDCCDLTSTFQNKAAKFTLDNIFQHIEQVTWFQENGICIAISSIQDIIHDIIY